MFHLGYLNTLAFAPVFRSRTSRCWTDPAELFLVYGVEMGLKIKNSCPLTKYTIILAMKKSTGLCQLYLKCERLTNLKESKNRLQTFSPYVMGKIDVSSYYLYLHESAFG